ncbi:MAG: hypothetical protein HY796_11730 [Elusimicrobia bacterium]|nr:hypothetical protein [Elusimicrobiota bacterium]
MYKGLSAVRPSALLIDHIERSRFALWELYQNSGGCDAGTGMAGGRIRAPEAAVERAAVRQARRIG